MGSLNFPPNYHQTILFYTPPPIYPIYNFPKTLISAPCISSKGFFNPSPSRFLTFSNKNSSYVAKLDRGKLISSASNGRNPSTDHAADVFTRKRRVVEHIFLLKAKDGLSEEEEKYMLDYLYTSQYQMNGIVAISLGRITNLNADGFTHAAYMRFPRKEDLVKFYENTLILRYIERHVMPYCQGAVSVDYESEVEDDILPIFRRGEEFNYGVEFLFLISVIESACGEAVDHALGSLAKLTLEFGSLIVQATQGSNFNQNSREYTHGAVIRFPSFEALEIFIGSSEYKDMWRWKFQPITEKALAVHFTVDPVGTDIM